MACAPPPPPDCEGAVREVAHVYERIKIQQPLLLLQCSSQPPAATAQLAHSLLGEALRALNVALSVMKPSIAAVKAEPHPQQQLSPPVSPASAADDSAEAIARRGKRRRSSSSVMEAAVGKKPSSSWVYLTAVPYGDGFQWRKYGEKKINGTSYTRSYFRCTYKDETGCQATKHIQQRDNSDRPMFQVTYNNEHTCNYSSIATATTTTSAANNNSKGVTAAASPPPPAAGHAAMVKQEQAVLLGPLGEFPALLPSEQTMTLQCQDQLLTPISMQQHFFCTGSAGDSSHGGDTPSTTSPCISGEFSDEYSGDMVARIPAAVEALAGVHDAFHDLELFLLCDSFKDY